MSAYWEIEKGWEPIVEKAAAALKELDDSIELMQVKEKFGGLRMYTNSYSDEVDAILREAEEEASNTCEFCGATEQVSCKGSWLKTLCDTCHEKRNKERRW